MISLFILGAFIGSGAWLIVDLNAENKILKDKIKTLENKELETKEESKQENEVVRS